MRALPFPELRQDAAFALRQLRKNPGFTLVAVFTLGLGIGATTAIFSLLYAVVLRPLPFADPERIVVLRSLDQGQTRSVSPGSFLAFRQRLRSVESLAASFDAGFNLTGEGAPERIGGALVSAGYFDAFGVRPALGRVFSAAEDRPGTERVVVLSNRLWRERFAADVAVVGRSVLLNGVPHAVLGVMPASFDLRSGAPGLWVPLALDIGQQQTNFGNSYLRVIGRLRSGASLAAANAEARTIAAQLEKSDPRFNTGRSAVVEGYVDGLLRGYRRRLWISLGAVGCVLLIACVNVSNLLLARGAGRSREIAIRAALGAGRGRMVRQLLTEVLVLALAGGATGLGLAYAGTRFLVAASPPGVPRLEQAAIDGPVLAFVLGLALLSSLLSGLVPALRTAPGIRPPGRAIWARPSMRWTRDCRFSGSPAWISSAPPSWPPPASTRCCWPSWGSSA